MAGEEMTITPAADVEPPDGEGVMAARVIACPGSSEPPPRPPIMSTTCPVCASPIASNEWESIWTCGRCSMDYHEASFWRALPIERWVAYLRWYKGTDDETHEADHDVCAACRQLEGLGK